MAKRTIHGAADEPEPTPAKKPKKRTVSQASLARARSLANLRGVQGNVGPKPPPRDKPKPTRENVRLFVLLTAAGLPPGDALARIAPDYHRSLTSKPLRQWINEWCSLPEITAGIDAYNHGPWQELTTDDRVEKAITHHINQAAYLLRHSDYLDPEADLGMIRDARAVLQGYVDKKSGGREDIYARVMRDILNGKEKSAGPPQLGPLQLKAVEKLQELTAEPAASGQPATGAALAAGRSTKQGNGKVH